LSRLAVPAMLRPSSLGRPAHGLALLFWTGISPAGGAKADGLSLHRRRQQSRAGDVQEFEREIDQDFRRQPGLPHDAPQPYGTANAKQAGEITAEGRIDVRRLSAIRHAYACMVCMR